MDFLELLRKKRDKGTLSKEELCFFANAAASGSVPDYQLSAMLMAMYLNGLDERETADLTQAMAHSGDMADLSGIAGTKGDKHSTGGVGDKTTLIVAPVAAACGVKMAKMSGRGLGHTGGTIDKLEAIPGFQTALSRDRFMQIVNETGLCVVGAAGGLCPADKALYALRDVTETVSSIPLIASSIMSKKLAGGADCIVLDVKCGSGAFMKTEDDARKLAEAMVDIGKRAGRRVAAVLTDMDLPLGTAVGNAVEVQEAVAVLRGEGPDDLRQVSLVLASTLLQLAGKGSKMMCEAMANDALQSGNALQTFERMVEAQGGDVGYIREPSRFPRSKHSFVVAAPQSGYLTGMDAEAIGRVCVLLGAGRHTKEDVIDPAAGLLIHKKTGDRVAQGDPLCTLLCEDEAKLQPAKDAYLRALRFGDTPPQATPLILDIIQ